MITKTDFIRLLTGGSVYACVSGMTYDGQMDNFGEDFAKAWDYCRKNPHSLYTLPEHILKATDALNTEGLSDEDAAVLKAAVFLRGTGKPAESISHTSMPLEKIGFSKAESERICFFAEYYDCFTELPASEETIKSIMTDIRRTAVHRISYYPTDRDFLLIPRIMRADADVLAYNASTVGASVDSKGKSLRHADETELCIKAFTASSHVKNICVFGASSNEISDVYIREAFNLGVCMAKEKYGLVFGAGLHGLMGATAEGVYRAGGKAIGVIPEKLHRPGIASPYCSELFVTPTMHERKAKMEQLSSAFIALPGGYGTFEELLEIITLKQLGYMSLPIVIMNINGYYNDLLCMFRHASDEGFADSKYLSLYHECTNSRDAIEYIKSYTPQDMPDKIEHVLETVK